jgi:serine/threonine protein kinase
MSFQIGETIGQYEIVGVLGKGGMGKVFRVRNTISDRMEAMKIALPSLEADAGLAERFLREIKVHASLDHPNIAQLHTALQVEGRLVMILELVEGSGLEEKLREGPIPVAEAVAYVDQTLSALAYAHSRGVIHRDLKPANMILTSAGFVKLTDFGIAQAAGATRVTKAGVALGSIHYMSPEQVKSGTLDGRSDIYSLGVSFYEMVTGKLPLDGSTEYSIMIAHLEETPVPPSDLNPSIPVAISAIILKAMAKEPEDRFQSAQEMQAALRTGEVAPVLSSGIDQSQLARVETHLLKAIGPIARHLVAKEARRHTTFSGLWRSLAEQIPGTREREAFQRCCEAEMGGARAEPVTTPPGGSTKVSGAVTVWHPAMLQATKQQLTIFMGPIGGIIVDRAARKARTPQELLQMVAAEIPSQRDREAFLAKFPR